LSLVGGKPDGRWGPVGSGGRQSVNIHRTGASCRSAAGGSGCPCPQNVHNTSPKYSQAHLPSPSISLPVSLSPTIPFLCLSTLDFSSEEARISKEYRCWGVERQTTTGTGCS
ncbi:unnamed protein product, partial [Coccothraustes coccothraustes]